MTKRHKGRQSWQGYLIANKERGPGDPTEYEVAVKELDAAALEAWIQRWYRSRYIPEDVLLARGLEPDDSRRWG